MHFIILLILFLILLSISIKYREGFLSQCTGIDCKSCADQSGCSWCKQTNACIPTQLIKSTDLQCNSLNVISSSFLCKNQETNLNDLINPNNEQLYKDQIADRVRPPNVYMNPNMEYSPETVMATLNDVKQTVDQYNMKLPDTIATSITDNIQPMVKGILSDRYQRECD